MKKRLLEVADLNHKLAEYENRIALLSQELERVNGNLRAKVDEVRGLEANNRNLQQEIEILRRKGS